MKVSNIRKKIAEFILGDETILFASTKDKELMETGDYLQMSDETLGIVTRRR